MLTRLTLRSIAFQSAVTLGLGSILSACADPCVDDGLVQKQLGANCPAIDSSTDTAAESAGASQSGTASGSGSAASEGFPSGTATAVATDTDGGPGTSSGPSASDSGPPPPHCENSEQDEDESDVDCGGSCEPCGDGKTCFISPDCESQQCATDMTCGATDWCVPLVDDNSCQSCIKSSCCESIRDCVQSDPKCACWLDCIERTNDFKPCEELCDVSGKPGQIISCANSRCRAVEDCGP